MSPAIATTSALGPVSQQYLLEASQMQALSFAVHIPLVCFGIAFPAMVLFVEWLYDRTGDEVYLTLARRWTRVPVGNAAGSLWTSWLNPTSALIGALAVTTGAYMAAVFLSGDARRVGDPELEHSYRTRALAMGVVTGVLAIGGLIVIHSDAPRLYHGLVKGDGLPALIVSAVAGISTIALVWVRRLEPARYVAAIAVAAIVAGWALAQKPVFLPGLAVRQAAAPHDTLVAVVVAVLAGAVILFPSLAALFRLTLTGRSIRAPPPRRPWRRRGGSPPRVRV
jgi:cytochrome bd-type quinol oxidase subunit 2